MAQYLIEQMRNDYLGQLQNNETLTYNSMNIKGETKSKHTKKKIMEYVCVLTGNESSQQVCSR